MFPKHVHNQRLRSNGLIETIYNLIGNANNFHMESLDMELKALPTPQPWLLNYLSNITNWKHHIINHFPFTCLILRDVKHLIFSQTNPIEDLCSAVLNHLVLPKTTSPLETSHLRVVGRHEYLIPNSHDIDDLNPCVTFTWKVVRIFETSYVPLVKF